MGSFPEEFFLPNNGRGVFLFIVCVVSNVLRSPEKHRVIINTDDYSTTTKAIRRAFVQG